MKPVTPAKWAAIIALVGALFWYGLQVTRPALPVTVQFRSVSGATALVLIFSNQSDQALSFTAALRHPGHQDEQKFAIQVRAHSAYELSSQEWLGRSGDRISLTSSNYKVWRGAIP